MMRQTGISGCIRGQAVAGGLRAWDRRARRAVTTLSLPLPTFRGRGLDLPRPPKWRRCRGSAAAARLVVAIDPAVQNVATIASKAARQVSAARLAALIRRRSTVVLGGAPRPDATRKPPGTITVSVAAPGVRRHGNRPRAVSGRDNHCRFTDLGGANTRQFGSTTPRNGDGRTLHRIGRTVHRVRRRCGAPTHFPAALV
jgi:hypothetical protein